MMGSSVILAVVQFSVIDRPMLAPLFVKAASKTPLTPEEPTTLSLALIGIGIIAAYVGIHRMLRPRRAPSERPWKTAASPNSRTEPPKRSAA